MTIDRAVEKLGFIKRKRIPEGELRELKALNLGIEALKRLKEAREQHLIRNDSPLPGETEDSEKQFLSRNHLSYGGAAVGPAVR
ncbi:hypothetical protein ES705_41031 [subsurface metagenome]